MCSVKLVHFRHVRESEHLLASLKQILACARMTTLETGYPNHCLLTTLPLETSGP